MTKCTFSVLLPPSCISEKFRKNAKCLMFLFIHKSCISLLQWNIVFCQVLYSEMCIEQESMQFNECAVAVLWITYNIWVINSKLKRFCIESKTTQGFVLVTDNYKFFLSKNWPGLMYNVLCMHTFTNLNNGK